MKSKLIVVLVLALSLAPIAMSTFCGACNQLIVCVEVFGSTDTWQHWCSVEEPSPQRCFDQEKRWALCQNDPAFPAVWAWETQSTPWQYGYTCDAVNVYCY